MVDKIFLAQQVNRALQLFAQNLTLPDTEAMEIADLYEPWQADKAYAVGKIIKYGVNQDNETQLYSVVQAHTSQANWLPDQTPALYKKIGFKDDIPIWTQPLGQHDAYRIGDKVSHKGKIWICKHDYNTYEPGVYGWEEVK